MTGPFASFVMGGFECSTQRRRDGVRLDVLAATAHARLAAQDYRQLRAHGIQTVRDGLRWHLIEPEPGRFDWSRFDPMLAAARETGTQVIWDLLHYGWPDWTNPFDADFIEAFAHFAEAAARRIAPGGFYVAINEISFLAWAGGEVGYLNPFVHGRGEELKMILCRAAIAATRRIRRVDPAATMVCAEPLIRAHPIDTSDAAVEHARARTAIQYDATDCLLGRRNPEYGGGEAMLDVIGVNYYPQNQWWPHEPVVTLPAARQAPLADLLTAASAHFDRPLLIAETGCEGDARADWFRMIAREARTAEARGVTMLGICLYPILDHPGWDDDRHCENGLLCGYSASPRPVHAPLATAIAEFTAPAAAA
ncbi:MAG: beta-galactosidase [Pseudomonadota bacterium]